MITDKQNSTISPIDSSTGKTTSHLENLKSTTTFQEATSGKITSDAVGVIEFDNYRMMVILEVAIFRLCTVGIVHETL